MLGGRQASTHGGCAPTRKASRRGAKFDLRRSLLGLCASVVLVAAGAREQKARSSAGPRRRSSDAYVRCERQQGRARGGKVASSRAATVQRPWTYPWRRWLSATAANSPATWWRRYTQGWRLCSSNRRSSLHSRPSPHSRTRAQLRSASLRTPGAPAEVSCERSCANPTLIPSHPSLSPRCSQERPVGRVFCCQRQH